MSPLAASIAIFVLISLGGIALVVMFTRQRALDERFADMAIKMRVIYGSLTATEIEEPSVARALFRWIVKRLPEPRVDSPEGKRIARILVQAGYLSSTAPSTFQVIRLLSAIAATALGLGFGVAIHRAGVWPVFAMITGAALGAWFPYYLVARRASIRQQEIAGNLSDALDLLVVCVEAGLGITEAIKIVASETERQGQEIGRELAMVSAEIAAGSTLGQALRGLADRTSVEDVKPLAATMIQSEQLGAQMGPALRSISDGLRNARRVRAEEAAQKTTVKILFPLVFFVLPAMMSVIVGPAILQIMRTMNGAH